MRLIAIRLVIAALVTLVMLCISAKADQWTYFYPESVIDFKCTSRLTEVMLNGQSRGELQWQAIAHADRNDKSLGSWEMALGRFPANNAGRHKAERVCSRWMDEASKRVKRAQ